ncbi:TIGR03943 family putative permease subunit [Streptosporangium roseum]|uniref:TIGR03943 family putative permease subunit n=1 Tax=Streptosporangium roseum TaxID=2001 RepID=UPI00032383ED
MNRVTQNLVLIMLGCAVLRISAFSTTYLNYVKPGFRPFLIGAGAVLMILGVAGLIQAWRPGKGSSGAGAHGGSPEHHAHSGDGSPDSRDLSAEPGRTPSPEPEPELELEPVHDRGRERVRHPRDQGHGNGHDHAHGGPRVAWLMCLPVFAIFMIAPPALGSFAAARSETPPPRDQALTAFTPLSGDGPVDMPVGEFIGRAWDDDSRSLTGRAVRLTGFVVPSKKKGQWYVTRMQIACCAADAFPLKVAVKGIQAPPPDTWVEVTGTWIPQTFGKMPNGVVYPQLSGTDLVKVDTPDEPYE